ncbi:MAG: hypothetical protein HFF36_07040 [Coprobacillus sp.]|nr:hypothetical protein [Coprobacillus sp.]MCI9093527.1 hypothetical protein [Coprobacillus sp.]
MNNQSKDQISIYIFRNFLATLCIAIVAMVLSLMQFYQCSLIEGMQRLFIYDIYTTLYFLLLWLLNYLIFEISKIIYDIYEERISYILCLIFLVLGIIIFLVPILDIFQYDFFFLCLLIVLRMLKQIYKKSNFCFLNKIKKTNNGLK